MKNKTSIHLKRACLFFGFLLLNFSSFAQDSQGGGDSSALILSASIALAIGFVFAFVILAMDFSIIPRPKGISRPKLPAHVRGDQVVFLKKGHDILLKGAPESDSIRDASVTRFAVQPPNFRGIAPIPKMDVEVGATVRAGDPVFHEKSMPGVKFVAPVSGEVIALNRGPKRAIHEVVILADKEIKYRELPQIDPEKASREELVDFVKDSGAWPLILQRPYNIIADPEKTPRDIFISTFNSAPLAPDLNLIVEGREEDFQKGLDLLGKLTSGQVHLGLDARSKTAPHRAFLEAENVRKTWFHGPHPAGNVGVQIHHIAPISDGNDIVWTLKVQDVITLGALLTKRHFDSGRVLALAGGDLKNPSYVRTHIGANIGELVKEHATSEHVRYISGDVLSGNSKTEDQFLDARAEMLTVIAEGDYYEMFGWLIPSFARPTVSNSYPGALLPGKKQFNVDTNTHGEKRAFVVTGQYEKVLPMDLYPQHIFKSILVNDFEQMENLGIYELVEEDVALCEFACTSKQPLQKILREGLDLMHEQG